MIYGGTKKPMVVAWITKYNISLYR